MSVLHDTVETVQTVETIQTVETAETEDTYVRFFEHCADSLEFSALHYHHNREPYYLLFIVVLDDDGNKDKVYIEKIDTHSHNNKYVYDIVMPYAVLESDENLKKYYDLSVMLANTKNSVYYDNVGKYSKYLIRTYDTDSDSEEEDQETGEKKPKRSERNWCINCDTIWKNMRLSKQSALNCYFNINPFTYKYKIDTDKKINGFLTHFNNFIKYNGVSAAIKEEITANYNNSLRLICE